MALPKPTNNNQQPEFEEINPEEINSIKPGETAVEFDLTLEEEEKPGESSQIQSSQPENTEPEDLKSPEASNLNEQEPSQENNDPAQDQSENQSEEEAEQQDTDSPSEPSKEGPVSSEADNSQLGENEKSDDDPENGEKAKQDDENESDSEKQDNDAEKENTQNSEDENEQNSQNQGNADEDDADKQYVAESKPLSPESNQDGDSPNSSKSAPSKNPLTNQSGNSPQNSNSIASQFKADTKNKKNALSKNALMNGASKVNPTSQITSRISRYMPKQFNGVIFFITSFVSLGGVFMIAIQVLIFFIIVISAYLVATHPWQAAKFFGGGVWGGIKLGASYITSYFTN